MDLYFIGGALLFFLVVKTYLSEPLAVSFIKFPNRFSVDFSKFVEPTKDNYPNFLKHTPDNSFKNESLYDKHKDTVNLYDPLRCYYTVLTLPIKLDMWGNNITGDTVATEWEHSTTTQFSSIAEINQIYDDFVEPTRDNYYNFVTHIPSNTYKKENLYETHKEKRQIE